MRLTYCSYFLEFKHPFGVSSNTRKNTPVVFVKIEKDGISGFGEACLPAYLGETVDQTTLFLEKVKTQLPHLSDLPSVQDIIDKIDLIDEGHNAAKAATDIALNDLFSKIAGKPFYDWIGTQKPEPRATSFTIGIDSEEKLIQKIQEAEKFSILKIKAGTNDDKALIELVRKHTTKPLYVDANQAWTDKHKVLDLISMMKEKGVLLVEQAMPVNMKADMRWVTERSVLPTIADESVKRLKDLENLEDAFSGINIKLMKCTGLNEAIKMIAFAKKKNIQIMLGCMAESSCATTAMAHLMASADFIDLDAPELYTNDPFRGLSYVNGSVNLNDKVGLGLEPTPALLDLF